MNKHFFKTLAIFTGMIAVGLLGVIISSYLVDGEVINTDIEAQTAE
jgi:hypothetical protein